MGESPLLPPLLWVDLRSSHKLPCYDEGLSRFYKIEIIADSGQIEGAISARHPRILCFDYDMPDQAGLDLLQKTKRQHPSLPIILFTQDQSAELAIWALRTRVWDYFIKPVACDSLISRISVLLKQCPVADTARRHNLMPQPLIPARPRHSRTGSGRAPTAPAISYVREQLHKKVTLGNVARLCGMGKSHFSRSFKSEHGVTFQEYLIRQRMARAVELLKDTDLQVTQVAYAVGFADLSNFTRMFQRFIGMSPSCYRKALARQRSHGHGERTLTAKFPKVNPNPVLSAGADGVPRFVNPAAWHLLQELGLERLDDVLPRNHAELVKACLKTRASLTEERKVAGHTLAWSYCPADNSDVVHIYGHDVTDYLSSVAVTEGLPKVNPNPVLSAGADGVPRFVNPAAWHLLRDFHLERLEDILPRNHAELVKACFKTRTSLAEECKAAGRTLVWSYCPADSGEVIYIYGHVSDVHEVAVLENRVSCLQ